jgi:Integrase core domain
VIERLLQTVKFELTHNLRIPLRRVVLQQDLRWRLGWYNEHRPHTTLQGRTPNEAYFHRRPAHRRPRWEPRPRWPRGAPCARPQVLVAGQPGRSFALEVQVLGGDRSMPVLRLARAG